MSTVIAPRDTYVVNRKFPMPYGSDTIDAWAVSSSNGLILISLYAIMMKAIVTQFWTGIVLFDVGIYLGRHPDGEADSADTKTTIRYTRPLPTHRRTTVLLCNLTIAMAYLEVTLVCKRRPICG